MLRWISYEGGVVVTGSCKRRLLFHAELYYRLIHIYLVEKWFRNFLFRFLLKLRYQVTNLC